MIENHHSLVAVGSHDGITGRIDQAGDGGLALVGYPLCVLDSGAGGMSPLEDGGKTGRESAEFVTARGRSNAA